MLFSPTKESLHQRLREQSVENTLEAVMEFLEEGYHTLHSCLETDTKVDKHFIETVARIRFSIATIMDVVVRESDSQDFQVSNGEKVQELMSLLKKMCSDSSINGKHIGPIIFMLRLTYRTYGKEFVFNGTKIGAQQFSFEWLFPQELKDDPVSGEEHYYQCCQLL